MDRQTDRKVEGDGVGRLTRQTNSGIHRQINGQTERQKGGGRGRSRQAD